MIDRWIDSQLETTVVTDWVELSWVIVTGGWVWRFSHWDGLSWRSVYSINSDQSKSTSINQIWHLHVFSRFSMIRSVKLIDFAIGRFDWNWAELRSLSRLRFQDSNEDDQRWQIYYLTLYIYLSLAHYLSLSQLSLLSLPIESLLALLFSSWKSIFSRYHCVGGTAGSLGNMGEFHAAPNKASYLCYHLSGSISSLSQPHFLLS